MAFFNHKNFWHLLLINFNLCFFVSLMILSFFPHETLNTAEYQGKSYILYILLPILNGGMTSVLCLGLNHYFARLNYTRKYYTQDTHTLLMVAFIAGCSGIYLSFSHLSTLIISLIIISMAFINIRNFAHQISHLLEPDKKATAQDLAEFANFFINLIITFTVVNLSINMLHNNFSLQPAFNFSSGIKGIFDALYFSIITITTVGYGHIIPNTIIARVAVSFECITSYIMLGIMIGIIGRGVTFKS